MSLSQILDMSDPDRCRAVEAKVVRQCGDQARPDAETCDRHRNNQPCVCECGAYFYRMSQVYRFHLNRNARPGLWCECGLPRELGRPACRSHDPEWPPCGRPRSNGQPCKAPGYGPHGGCETHRD